MQRAEPIPIPLIYVPLKTSHITLAPGPAKTMFFEVTNVQPRAPLLCFPHEHLIYMTKSIVSKRALVFIFIYILLVYASLTSGFVPVVCICFS